MHMHIGVYVCTHICINPNEDGPPATPISDGVHDIFSSYVTPIQGHISPSPSNERCTIGPAPLRVRLRDVAQHADTRTYKSSPIP